MIVLDTSAAVDMVRRTPEAMALRTLMLCEEKVLSCELMRVETANVCRRMVRCGALSPIEADWVFSKAVALVDEYVPSRELETEAFREGIRLGHSVYDLLYFVLARRTGSTLFTLDRKLMRLCEAHGVDSVTEEELKSL